MRRLRRFYWRHIRRWDGELCWRCGRKYYDLLGRTWWRAPDWLWVKIMGHDGGLLCPLCFARACEEAGTPVYWSVRVAG